MLAMTLSAGAEGCVPSAANPEVQTCSPVPVGLFGQCECFDNDLCQPDCLFAIDHYSEANGIEGLQRNDEVVDNTCSGQIEADTLVY